MKKFILFIILSLTIISCNRVDNRDRDINKKIDASIEKEKKENTEKLNKEKEEKIHFIREKLFITQINQIYLNIDEFLGKVIELEGFIDTQINNTTGKEEKFVMRLGPGCCAFDEFAGFVIKWDKDFPVDKQWVRLKGVLEQEGEGKTRQIYLRILEIEEKDEMGKIRVEH